MTHIPDTKHWCVPQNDLSKSQTASESQWPDHMTHKWIRMRLTVLNPGKRLTAEAASNGNGRNCFRPNDVWTAGRVGRTRAGMRPFWHALPVRERDQRQHVELQNATRTDAWAKLMQSRSKWMFSLCVFSLPRLFHHIALHCETLQLICGSRLFGYLAPAAQKPPNQTFLTLAAVFPERVDLILINARRKNLFGSW